jgi:hypothetical protein
MAGVEPLGARGCRRFLSLDASRAAHSNRYTPTIRTARNSLKTLTGGVARSTQI